LLISNRGVVCVRERERKRERERGGGEGMENGRHIFCFFFSCPQILFLDAVQVYVGFFLQWLKYKMENICDNDPTETVVLVHV
jgi:hypothetical protein